MKLLSSPGLPLRNALNKCWFHSTLQVLNTLPLLLNSERKRDSVMATQFLAALTAIRERGSSATVANFLLVMDFKGANNRYGQIAVPDFMEFLALQLPSVFQPVLASVSTRLQCSKCKWISYSSSRDMLLKVYIPPGDKKSVSLGELLEYNSSFSSSSVNCGRCGIKTRQVSTRESCSDIMCLEIIRVTQNHLSRGLQWSKNCMPISFPTMGITIPGSEHKYRIIGTCHHQGSLRYGHWFTRVITTSNVWYELDDLRGYNIRTVPPGNLDSTVVILILVKEAIIH